MSATQFPLALVFTDIVGAGAAKRAAALGPDASPRDRAYLQGLQIKHQELVRDAVAAHNGNEIMTVGDSFVLTFEDPVDSIRCAAAIQQRLKAHPIDTPSGPMQIRIGIHTGTPEFFDDSWHGEAVDTAARAESAGSAGQVIVTDAAREAIGDLLGIHFTPLGTFALKGVGDVRLWDADYDQHGVRSPALRSKEDKASARFFSTVTACVLVLVIAALGIFSLLHRRQPQFTASAAPAAKDSIILANIENKTGDPVFDTTLTQALGMQMQQSPALNLVSQQHLRQSMRYLGKSPDEPLTPAIVREAGQREGIKAYLTGTIAKAGNAYFVSVSARKTSTGGEIATEHAQAPDKEHVLEAVGTASSAMRARLGESPESIQKLDTPIGRAMTPSLEAFHAYALGDVEHEQGLDIPQAERHYRQAVEIDPNFAMAWARLGVVYANSGQVGKALECHSRANELSKNVSERERLYIQGHYYTYSSGDLRSAIKTLELAARTYPLSYENYVNLSVALSTIGQLEKSIEPLHNAIALVPDDAIAQEDLFGGLIALDKFKEATDTLANIHRLGIDDGTGMILYIYYLDLLTGKTDQMSKVVARTEGRADEYQMTQGVAFVDEFSGRYREANSSWQHAAEQAAAQKASDAEASFLLDDLSGRAMAGLCEDPARKIKAALMKDNSKPTVRQAAFTAALCGDAKTALPLMANLAKAYPEDTVANEIILPQSRAALALAAHHPEEARRELEGSEPYDLISPAAYLQGLACLELHDGPCAADAFKRATRYRGAMLQGMQDYGQAQLGLARAYVMNGNEAAAKKAYESLFVTWIAADSDLAQLLAAKKEYAELH